jgi:hypothetical protein
MNYLIFKNWGDLFGYYFKSTGMSILGFIPWFLLAVITFVLGWWIATIIGRAIEQVINALKIDRALNNAGAGTFTERTGIRVNVGAFIGGLVKWFIIIVFLMASLDFMQLTSVSTFLRAEVIGYLPKIVEVALVLIIATLIGDFMSKLVTASAKASGVRSANFLGSLTRYAIFFSAFIISLGELGIASAYMQYIFIALVAMFALAGGLAFGLGGRDAAARALERLHDRVKPMN